MITIDVKGRVKVVISGFGTVGRALTKLLIDKGFDLVKRATSAEVSIVGVVDSKGAVIKESGFTCNELFELLKLPRGTVSTYHTYGRPGATTIDVIDLVQPDILIEVTPANYVTGNPALKHIEVALCRGIHVVTSNKAPLALKFSYLINLAKRHSSLIRYSATVMAGTPVLDLLGHTLWVQSIKSIKGILNGTTNYILTSMFIERRSFEEALKIAQERGFAEADPSLDVDGWDPAAKLVILVNTLLGTDYRIHDVERISLREVSKLDVEELRSKSKVVKYLASAVLEGEEVKELCVKPSLVSCDDILASVNWEYNAVLIETGIGNRVFLRGIGAGGLPTASTILSDLVQVLLGNWYPCLGGV